MIGDKVKLGGIWVIAYPEEQYSGCHGCCFNQEDDDDTKCVLQNKSNLECDSDNAIYKVAKVEKGIKKKLTLN